MYDYDTAVRIIYMKHIDTQGTSYIVHHTVVVPGYDLRRGYVSYVRQTG
jgi:hypothetical protein